jgi:hypothetical protein
MMGRQPACVRDNEGKLFFQTQFLKFTNEEEVCGFSSINSISDFFYWFTTVNFQKTFKLIF